MNGFHVNLQQDTTNKNVFILAYFFSQGCYLLKYIYPLIHSSKGAD